MAAMGLAQLPAAGFVSDLAYPPALQDVDAKCTIFVILACVVAASGGLLFGYDG